MFTLKRIEYFRFVCDSNGTLKRKYCSNVRKNSLGIQMIADSLRKQIFGCASIENSANLDSIKKHLHKHGLWKSVPKSKGNKKNVHVNHDDKPMFDIIPKKVVDFKIPELKGSNVDEHFLHIGNLYSKGYERLADELVTTSIPIVPRIWKFCEGWTRYETDSDGNVLSMQKVSFPTEDALVFDVEVCMTDSAGDRPTMATAVSGKYWYSWCSTRLFESDSFADISFMKTETTAKLSDLIPMGKWLERERIFIGHNVSFDRSFIKEQYDLKADKTRFLDTMSLHIAMSGLTGYQRALSRSLDVSKRKGISNFDAISRLMSDGNANPLNWQRNGSLNSLADVFNFYCQKELNKEKRDVFVKGSLNDVKNNFQDLMSYCAQDVCATFEVFCKEWATFKDRFPHPATLAGMLEMSVMYLPVNTANWNRYLEESQATYDDMERELSLYLQHLANDACRLMKNERYKKDIWMWDLDWSTQSIRWRKNTAEISLTATKKRRTFEEENENSHITNFVKELLNSRNSLTKVQPFLAGYPLWYREFCESPFGARTPKNKEKKLEWEPGPFLISTQMRSVPKLMRLLWKGYVLHYQDNEGWGYLIPEDTSFNSQEFPLENYCKILIDTGTMNPDSNQGVISPDEFLTIINDKTKSSETDNSLFLFGCKFYRLPHKDGPESRVGNPLAKEFLRHLDNGNLKTSSSNAANLILKLSKDTSYWKMNHKRIYSQMVIQSDSVKNFSALLPRVVVSGTVTRRAVEGTWLTASNAKEDRVGSELKAMIQAPEGYKFVGADVDSQELWIASILGDSSFGKIHGCTAIGWMTLQGSRADGTDMHSKVSHLVGISRDQAKVLNYGRIYGAGKLFAARFLKMSNPQFTEEEAMKKAYKIYTQTKGRQKMIYDEDGSFRQEWSGGSESHLFNQLQAIASLPEPRTPVLSCKISTALIPEKVKADFMTSIVNWVVQSSAVDYLHLLLLAMKWLMNYYNIDGRFAISIHDEVRYLVADEDRYKAALALQIANLLTRSIFTYKLSIMDLPQSVAFFSRVEIDTVLRKEVDMNCVTPSNPHGLLKGYNIPFGESLTINELLKVEEISKMVQRDIYDEQPSTDVKENTFFNTLNTANDKTPHLTL